MNQSQPSAADAPQPNERVALIGSLDFHGIDPDKGNLTSWCGHCHITYRAALECSKRHWPEGQR